MAEHFDAIVIGAGQAGPAMAARCSKEGLRVAIIERKRFGGTCVNNGCIPTKTLVASARAVHMARRGAQFGFDAGEVKVDMARVMQRKDDIVRQSAQGVEGWMRGLSSATVIQGHAAFTGPRTVQMNGNTLSADRIFIDVGGRAVTPDMPGINQVTTLNNASIMSLNVVPEHLLIIGGSYIGLEFAQIMRRLGARVTVIEKSPLLLPREDRDVADAIAQVLQGEGIELRLGADCFALEAHPCGRIGVQVACESNVPVEQGTHVLLATGRTPNTADLGLEEAGVQTDARGFIQVNDALQTSVPGIWALGECNGRGAFTHTAWNDYEIVAANLFEGAQRKVTDRIPCYALFTDPPLGRIGATADEVRKSGKPALVAKLAMSRVGRAREAGEMQGFMKVLVDRESSRILGAALFGLSGDEAIHGLLQIMNAGLPYTAMQRAVPIHPTVSELLPTLLEGLAPLQ
jgi:pyruvate/2-oxoglutarate dehydrogenase complex dihydrolipoamide dehydrogenase (E3) component